MSLFNVEFVQYNVYVCLTLHGTGFCLLNAHHIGIIVGIIGKAKRIIGKGNGKFRIE